MNIKNRSLMRIKAGFCPATHSQVQKGMHHNRYLVEYSVKLHKPSHSTFLLCLLRWELIKEKSVKRKSMHDKK